MTTQKEKKHQTWIAKFGDKENANEMESSWVLHKCFLMCHLAKTESKKMIKKHQMHHSFE